jgi:hypothetical protein
MARIRSRQIESQDVRPRRLAPQAVEREAIGTHAVGRDQIGPGAIDARLPAPQSVQDVHLHPSLIPMEVTTFQPWESSAPVVVSESDPYPVQRGGGAVRVTVQLAVAPASSITVGVKRNGTSIGTLVVTGTQQSTTFATRFVRNDTVIVGVTDGDATASGLVVVLRWLPSVSE